MKRRVCESIKPSGYGHRSHKGTAMPSARAPSAPGPLQTRLELGAQPTAPGVARGHVRAVAREWGLAGLADTAELLTSELVTNAVQASERLTIRADLATLPVIRLWVTSDGISLIIHVWDASDEMPVLKDFAQMTRTAGGYCWLRLSARTGGRTARQRAKWSG